MRFGARTVGRRQIPEEQSVVLDHAVLEAEDFSGRRLLQFSASGCRFKRCKFEKMTIEGAGFGDGHEQSEYVECRFDASRINVGPGGYARFVRCSFREVDLRDWFCFTVELVECTFTGVLRTVVFNGTVPPEDQRSLRRTKNEFRGNDFASCDLIDVDFRSGIDLEAQRLPTGPAYLYLPNAEQSLHAAMQRLQDWNVESKRSAAMGLIRACEWTLAGGQKQLLLRRDDYSDVDRDVVSAVFELLSPLGSE